MGTSFWGVEKCVLNPGPASRGTISWVIVTPPPSFGILNLGHNKKSPSEWIDDHQLVGDQQGCKKWPQIRSGFLLMAE